MTDDNKNDFLPVTPPHKKAYLVRDGGSRTYDREGNLKGSTSFSKNATLTSVASLSAEVFDPTNVEAIRAFQESLKPLNKGTLFLLADEPDNTAQAGIETRLPSNKVKLLTDVEIAEREAQENHKRELAVVREKTKGSIWVELLKYGIPALVTFVLTYFGLKGGR